MPSKNQHSNKSILWVLIAILFMGIGILMLLFGQIWIAPILITLGLGILVKQYLFRKDPTQSIKHILFMEHAEQARSTSYHQEIFWNLPLSRILVIMIIIILAIIDAALYRTPLVDRYNPIGSWQILMGPTLFYPLVFLPLLMTIGMIFQLVFSIRKITFTRTNNILAIQEEGLVHFINHVNLEEIREAQVRSNYTGLKAFWLIPWSIQIWGNFSSAWHYFSNEFTFGTGRYIGPMYLIHSIIYFAILLLLIFAPEYEFRWTTPSQEYALRFFAFRSQQKFSAENMAKFLSVHSEHTRVNENFHKDLKKRNYFFGLGIFLFIIPILSIIFSIFFSDIPRIFIFMGSVASFGVAMKDNEFIHTNQKAKVYVNYRLKKDNLPPKDQKIHHHPLEIMLFISEIIQLLSIGMILTLKWRLYPLLNPNSSLIWVDILISSILGIVIVFVYLKKQWDILEERNSIFQYIAIIGLGFGILLAFLL